MKTSILTFIFFIISFSAFSQSQLKSSSLMQFGEVNYFLIWFRTTNYKTFKLSNIPKDSLHIKDCVYEKLKRIKSLDIVKVYKCESNQHLFPLIKDFESDFSEYLNIPFFDFFIFDKVDSVYDELLFKVEDYHYFNRSNSIYCGDQGFEKVWSDIKREAKDKNWDLYKINVYQHIELKQLGYLIEYEGVSYRFKGDKLVPLMKYLEQNYTLEEYKAMFVK